MCRRRVDVVRDGDRLRSNDRRTCGAGNGSGGGADSLLRNRPRSWSIRRRPRSCPSRPKYSPNRLRTSLRARRSSSLLLRSRLQRSPCPPPRNRLLRHDCGGHAEPARHCDAPGRTGARPSARSCSGAGSDTRADRGADHARADCCADHAGADCRTHDSGACDDAGSCGRLEPHVSQLHRVGSVGCRCSSTDRPSTWRP